MAEITITIDKKMRDALASAVEEAKKIQTTLIQGGFYAHEFEPISIQSKLDLWEDAVEAYDEAVGDGEVDEEGAAELTLDYMVKDEDDEDE